MKKFILILAVMFVWKNSAGADEAKKLEFVNPVFNQPLKPMANNSGYVYLTPTSIDFRTPLDKNILDSKGECDLLENTKDHIKMFCKVTRMRDEKELKYAQNILKHSTDEISIRNAKLTMEMNSGNYTVESYYIYKIEGIHFEGCLDIAEMIYKEGQQQYSSESHYCVTPPTGYTATKD